MKLTKNDILTRKVTVVVSPSSACYFHSSRVKNVIGLSRGCRDLPRFLNTTLVGDARGVERP